MTTEKVLVEAESNITGDVTLTLADVRQRRALTQQFGDHAAHVKITTLEKIGFPSRYLEDLKYGRPVRFKMNHHGFVNLLSSGGNLDGLGATMTDDHYEHNPAYTHYVVVHVDDTPLIESGWEYREDAKDRYKEIMSVEPGLKPKVTATRTLKSMRLDPRVFDAWFTGLI